MKSWKVDAAAFAARASFCVLMGFAGVASAAEQPWDRNPIVIYPSSARQNDPAAAALVEKARADGQVRVIVGLRTTLHPQHAVAPAVAAQELQALQSVQTSVATRVLGSAAAPSAIKFEFIPYMSMFVDAAQAQRLLADPDVASIQEDIPKPPTLADSVPIINADKMWNINYTGSGWVVAVLDTGADKTHPMLKGKVVSEACYSTTNSAAKATSVCPGGKNSTSAGSGVNCPTSVASCDHGTHVSSIAMGSSSTLSGVAKGAQLLSIQVFSKVTNAKSCGTLASPCALSYSTDQVLALQRVYALRKTYKIAGVNMSLGGGKFSTTCDKNDPSVASAITQLQGVNIATLVASGNSSYDGFVGDPACVSDAIAIGATTKSDTIASYSNHATLVKLLAPGDNINAAVPGGKYAVKSGTSMATPHVTGAFGLLRASVPNVAVDDVVAALACTGKSVARNGLAKQRIDVFDAYRRMRPPSSTAVWTFSDADDAIDWANVRQSFNLKSGYLTALPSSTGYAATVVPNCNVSFDLTAQVKRIDPDGFWINGLAVKTVINYKTMTASGYFLFYGNDGSAALYRIEGLNLGTGASTSDTPLCDFKPGFTVNKTSDNTIEAIANGKTLKYYLNNKLVCSVTDSTYKTGQVMAFAYFPDGASGHSFGINKVQIKSLETKYPSPNAIDPAAYASAPVGGLTLRRTPAHGSALSN